MSIFRNKVLLIDTERANLPELVIYKKELEKNGYLVDVLKEKEVNQKNLEKYNIIWNFMGIDKKIYNENQFIIHDYRSASSRLFPKIRDLLKKKINIKPNLRIFLNDSLREYYSFKDNIPSLTLDMGIDLEKFKPDNEFEKYYKFCYLGDVNSKRKIDKFLKWFLKSEFKSEKLLLIGPYEEKIYIKYKKYENIIFLGKIPYELVPKYLKKSEYALNLIPNEFPFNIQTSTKLLEYISLNLKIISTKNEYSLKIMKKHKNLSFYIFENYEDITKKTLENFEFKNINMISYSWENILKDKIQVLKKLVEGKEYV